MIPMRLPEKAILPDGESAAVTVPGTLAQTRSACEVARSHSTSVPSS